MPANAHHTDGDVARAVSAAPLGSGPAESELYRRFAPRVRLYGLRHLRSEDAAGDLVQQVLLVTIEKLRAGAVREPDQIASFILGMSRTMAHDQKRQEWRREKLREAFMAPSPCAPQTDDILLDVGRLKACLGGLAERDRLVMVLTFYAEKTATEVGRELGVTVGNVRVIRHRAMQRLRTCVMAEEVAS